jgi:hypothetical protein
MGFLTAWVRYHKLDERQKDFMESKVLRASLPLDAWIRFLYPVTVVKRDVEAVRSWLVPGAFLCVLGGIISVFAFRIGWPLLAIPLGAFLGVYSSKMEIHRFPPELDEFVLPWLALLREDVASGSPVLVELDLRGRDCSAKEQRERRQLNPDGADTQYYRDTWFSGEAAFADHAVVRWGITDQVRTRTRMRTNPRGKSRHKVKFKVVRTFDIQVRVRGKDFRVSAGGDEGGVRTDIRPGERRTRVRSRSRKLLKSIYTPPRLVEMVDAVAVAYRHLSPSDSSPLRDPGCAVAGNLKALPSPPRLAEGHSPGR